MREAIKILVGFIMNGNFVLDFCCYLWKLSINLEVREAFQIRETHIFMVGSGAESRYPKCPVNEHECANEQKEA